MRYIFFLFSLLLTAHVFGNKTTSEIYVNLEKVHSLKRVLYIAAHPDDENTRALAWFSLGEKAETAYLSLTRGDGGQNLIGDELSEDLGVLRTQELLAARRIDGARQYFTRAVDFGYSKSADESLEKWGESDILSDVVLVIRQFKPDVIITRFPADKRAGHGHHTAATLLALEAFEKAADPAYLPNQVAEYGAWKTTSIYWNSSVWWDKELSTTAKNDPQYMVQEIGGYNSLLGMSYNEIGTLARSQHKCQGFGAIVERGSLTEYFQYLGGKQLQESFFENNTMTWTKLVSKKYSDEFDALLADFDFKSLENNIPALLSIRKKLNVVPASNLDAIRKEKVAQLDRIIVDCLGLYAEIVSSDYAYVQGEDFKIKYNLTNRSSRNVQLMSIQVREMVLLLEKNKTTSKEISIQNNHDNSSPYWLKNAFGNVFKIDDPSDLGKAEGEATFRENLTFIIDGDRIQLEIPVTYKWRDPSYGERRRNVISAPNFSANFDQKSIILKPGQEKTIRVKVHAYKENLSDELKINAPDGWEVSPQSFPITTTDRHEEVWVEIKIKSKETSKRGDLVLTDSKGKELKSLTEITYDHIPTQVIYKPATLICIPLKADIVEGNVAYINGAGDAVAAAVTQLGFNVTAFEVSDLATLDLSKFQSVILGIRIYNIHPELRNFDSKLFEYVSNGGNLVMQYNTAGRSASGKTFGPIPFELSRKRVTEEDSKVTFLAPDHQIMNRPNKITQVDFNNWVQERGLYFADNWDEAYTPLFSWNDNGEDPVEGALIVAKHGKGQFVYTGISFFRELPNGVEGAYRLFANILSYQP